MAVVFDQTYAIEGHIGAGRVNLVTDTFKVALTNIAPNLATIDGLADIAQIPSGNGYVDGGVPLTSVTFLMPASDGRWRFTSAPWRFDASNGPIGPFHYMVIYSDTSVGKKIIGSYDWGSALTIPDGSGILFDPGSNGIWWRGKGTLV